MITINNKDITKKWVIGLFSVAVLFTACNDRAFLEEVPQDFLAPQNAYSTPEGISQGITGLHFRVRNDWYYGEELQDVGAIYKGLGTDLAFHGEDPNSTRFLCNYVNYLTPSSEYVKEYWDRPYKLVQQVNLLVEGINATGDALYTPEERDVLIAEALFFRAFAYRHLVSFFGDVPVVREAIDFAKTDFVRDPTSAAYQLMEEDLTFATQHLPNPGSEEAPGRITKGAAYHLLTEVYLMQHKYNEAVEAATHVIDDFGYYLMTERFGSNPDVFGSGDVFSDLFAYGNQNLPENKEAIWVIQYEPSTVIGGSSNRWNRAFGPAYFRMGNTPDGKPAFRGELVNGAYTGYSDSLGRGVSWIRPTNLSAYTLWEGNWYNDFRNAKHMIKRDFYYDSPGSAYDGQKIDFSEYPSSAGRDAIRDTCQYIYPYFLKFADPMHVTDNEATSGNGNSYKDLYGMRLAETYLYRAEAYIGLGQPALARDDINAVRTRSHATPVETADVDIDYLLDEYGRELYGEVCRHFVLRRTGKLIERVRKYNNNPLNPGLNIQDYNVLWPIPQDQMDLNVDAVWEQNPGY